MRVILFAAALCFASLASVTTSQANPYFGNSDHVRQSLGNWTGSRSYSHQRNTYSRRYARRGNSYRHHSNHRYSHHRYASRHTRKTYGHRHSASRHYASRRSVSHGSHRRYASRGAGPRPRAWCGWWMRTQLGGGPAFNLAANWRHYGRPSRPQVGAVVVWPHHVGIITGRASNGRWIVKSGNDGGRVRERPRSVAGAVFRMG
jgi:hypothetical protein